MELLQRALLLDAAVSGFQADLQLVVCTHAVCRGCGMGQVVCRSVCCACWHAIDCSQPCLMPACKQCLCLKCDVRWRHGEGQTARDAPCHAYPT